MKLRDIFMLSLHQVRYGGMKTLLCIIAMVTGVFAFCMSCYASQYAIRTVELELNKLGIRGIAFYSKNFPDISDRDIKSIEAVKGIKSIMPVSFSTGSIKMKNSERTALIIGADDKLQDIWNVQLLYGRLFSSSDFLKQSNVAIVDSGYAYDIYRRENILGKEITVTIDGLVERYEIIGVISPQKESIQSLVGTEVPEIVYIPSYKISRTDALTMACMNKSNSEDVCVRVQNKIQDLTGVYVGYKNLDIYLENFKQITNIVTLLGSVLASLSLIVGGIGLTSNMLNKTEQRKYEIGVYLSIGASKKDICLMFLFEAILICLFGGVVGWGISSALFDVLSDYIGNVIVSDSKIALYGVFASGICGILFGLFPAVKAASMKPIDAIRC